MYTTSPQPFLMDIVRAALEKWSREADAEREEEASLDG